MVAINYSYIKNTYMKIVSSLLFVTLLVACSDKKQDDTKKDANKNAPIHYDVALVEQKGVTTQLKLPSQLVAYQQVSIFPKVNGYVKTVLVDIGSKVKKGDLLMILEAPELEEAVLQAKEKFARAKSDFSIDKDKYFRLIEAAQTPGAVSPLDLSSAKTKMEADSALSNAEKANWNMQQTMMEYLKVIAPFDGVITIRNVHPGALVSAAIKDIPMLELKEVKHLRLEVDIPENVSAQLKQHDTLSFVVDAFPGKKMVGVISRKSMNINTQMHVERIELDVYNNDEKLAPGMFADVVYDAKGTTGALSVPKSAVVTSTERKYVIAVRDNKSVKVDVITGNESIDKVEIFGDIKEGEKVIVNANDDIKEGITIQ